VSSRQALIDELKRENATLRKAVALLHRVAKLVRAPLELEPTYYAILTGVTAGLGLGLNRAMLFLVDESDREMLRGVAAVGPRDAEEADRVWRSIVSDDPDLDTLYEHGLRQRDHPGPLDVRVRAARIPIAGDTPIGLALRKSEMVRGTGSDDLGGLLHLPTAVATPLRGRSQTAGVLYGDNRFTERRLDPDAELVLSLLADHAGRAIESAWAYERVAKEARTDALTGLPHHGAMMEAVAEAVAAAAAAGQPLGLAMIDLDDFKKVNDQLGHLAGDALLAAVSERLRNGVRAGATPYRYGGEEFAVLFPGLDDEQVRRAGERLRRTLSDDPYRVGPERLLPVTCSIGLATLGQETHDAHALIARADEALLAAKRAGKNRVQMGNVNTSTS
jgi:diguanylate cyclase (GGDEF)-like protein